MNEAAHLLKWTADFLNRKGVAWALVGGWAVSIRTEPRFTRDLDIVVAIQTDADAEKQTADFVANRFQVTAIIEQESANRLATVRLRPPHDYHPGLLLDLLFASSGIEPEICSTAEHLEVFPDIVVPVARMECLLAVKILARDDDSRPQDQLDIRMLLRAMDSPQISTTRALLDLVTTRGYHRGKDLQTELDRFQH